MFKKPVYGLALLLLLTSAAAIAQTTVHVVPVSGNPTASGAALLSALAGITDATSFKPYVLKLDPAGYYVGSTPVVMKPYVDIEGSGQGAIAGPVLGSPVACAGAYNANYVALNTTCH
jgi:hypothetical protein